MRNLIAGFVFLLASASLAWADMSPDTHIPDGKKVGSGRLSVVFWDVYDATLYAPGGTWDPEKPHALLLHYFREIEGPDIADRSVAEMRKQGFTDEKKLADWQAQMRGLFPQVHNGSELMAVAFPGKSTDFYQDGKKIGTIQGGAFTELFFNIWLGEKTTEPALRRKLLGLT